MLRLLSLITLFFIAAFIEQNAYANTIPNVQACSVAGSNICYDLEGGGTNVTCVGELQTIYDSCLQSVGACIWGQDRNTADTGLQVSVLQCPPNYDPCGGGTLVTNGYSNSFCTEPTGGGDGDGDGDGDDPVDQGTATANGSCDSKPLCAGGSPQRCAILFQSWYNGCRMNNSLDELGAELDNLEDYYEVDDDDVLEGIKGHDHDISETVDMSFTQDVGYSAGSCPAPRSVNLISAGTITITFQPLCDLAIMIRPFLIAIASFFAGYMVYKQLVKIA